MAVAADRQRKLVVGNHGDGALFPRLRHGNDRSGRKRFCDKFQRIFAPEDNVYLFPAELFYDGVDPRAFISHAGAHGIDARIVGANSHFRTVAGFAGAGLDLHDPLRDFGHLLLKQFLDEAGGRARNEDLRIFSAVFDALDKYLEPIAHHEQVENLVAAEAAIVSAGPFSRIEHAAHRVEYAAQNEPEHPCLGHGAHQRGQHKDRHPAHKDVDA